MDFVKTREKGMFVWIAFFKKAHPYFILASVSVLVFCNTLSNGFVYDDSVTIVNNNLITRWENIRELFSFHYFILSGELSYRPVVTFTYFIDHFLWGKNPAGFHTTNIIIHALNSMLLYAVVFRITRINKAAFFSALLFAVHPVLTEAINCISYREDLLVACFFLTSFLFFLKIDHGFIDRGTFILFYALSLCAFFLALFSKEMAITLPILLIVYHAFSSPRSKLYPFLKKKAKSLYCGYVLLTCFYVFIRFVLFREVTVKLSPSQGFLGKMPIVIATYIKHLFLPFHLNADYVVPPVSQAIPSLVISIMLFIPVIVIFARLGTISKQYCFFLSWFFVTLLPVCNIIPLENIMADRYLYLPVMGFCGVAGLLVHSYFQKKWLAGTGLGIIVMVFSIISIYRSSVWQDEFSLWQATVRHEPDSVRAHHNLGVIYHNKGLYQQAETEFKKSLELKPMDYEAHYNLGNLYEKQGRLSEAGKQYHEAIQYNSYASEAYNGLGNVYKKKNMVNEAIKYYKEAILRNPFNPVYHNNLGIIYSGENQYQRAIAEFQKGLELTQADSSIYYNLANAYKATGDLLQAEREYRKALNIDPQNEDIHNNLGIVYMNLQQPDKAIHSFETAIRLNPQMGNVHNNLGVAYAQKGDTGRAIRELKDAVKLGFDNEDVHNNLAGVYMSARDMDNAIHELRLVLQFNPENGSAHCNLGNAYISRGRKDKAISEFQEAIRNESTNASFYYHFGNALFKTGAYSRAAGVLNQSVNFEPDNPSAHKLLGIIYANHLHDKSKALFHLTKTLHLDSQQPMAGEIAEAIRKLKE